MAAGGPTAEIRHPLDPLDAADIRRAVKILRRERPVTAEARFVSVSLNEPGKDQTAPPREAFVVLLEPRQHTTYEAVVSLTADAIPWLRPVPGAAPR